MHNCNHISNCGFEEALNCDHIDNCAVVCDTQDAVVFDKCEFICGISITLNGLVDVVFRNCSYLSNIRASDGFNTIAYMNCKYVDAQSCAGFIGASNAGKIQALTNDGTFRTVAIYSGEAVVE